MNFGWHSTSDEVLEGIDRRGKRALVTSVSAGLGEKLSAMQGPQ